MRATLCSVDVPQPGLVSENERQDYLLFAVYVHLISLGGLTKPTILLHLWYCFFAVMASFPSPMLIIL